MSIQTNSRVVVGKSMPPLAEACASFKGFSSNEQCGDRIFEMLMVVIQRYRGAVAKRFYTMRKVADFFGVSLGTAQTVFRDLKREGALTSIRSSQTMIPARASRSRLAVRGVVCMPIWMPGFAHFQDWRSLFSVLEEELSRHRFVLEPVFYKQNEDARPEFVERVLKFDPDYVVWNAPVPIDRMTMESIADTGVPILSIMGARDPALPGRIYRTSLERALRRGLEEWKASGQIDQVVIPSLGGGSKAVAHQFGSVLQASPLPYQFKSYHPDRPLRKYLASLATDRRTGIFFGDDMFFIQLCAIATEEMFQLFRRHRVMVYREVAMHSFSRPSDIFVDRLAFPDRQLTRRIAADLSQSKGALPSTEEIFEGEWRQHTPLKDLIQFYFNE